MNNVFQKYLKKTIILFVKILVLASVSFVVVSTSADDLQDELDVLEELKNEVDGEISRMDSDVDSSAQSVDDLNSFRNERLFYYGVERAIKVMEEKSGFWPFPSTLQQEINAVKRLRWQHTDEEILKGLQEVLKGLKDVDKSKTGEQRRAIVARDSRKEVIKRMTEAETKVESEKIKQELIPELRWMKSNIDSDIKFIKALRETKTELQQAISLDPSKEKVLEKVFKEVEGVVKNDIRNYISNDAIDTRSGRDIISDIKRNIINRDIVEDINGYIYGLRKIENSKEKENLKNYIGIEIVKEKLIKHKIISEGISKEEFENYIKPITIGPLMSIPYSSKLIENHKNFLEQRIKEEASQERKKMLELKLRTFESSIKIGKSVMTEVEKVRALVRTGPMVQEVIRVPEAPKAAPKAPLATEITSKPAEAWPSKSKAIKSPNIKELDNKKENTTKYDKEEE